MMDALLEATRVAARSGGSASKPPQFPARVADAFPPARDDFAALTARALLSLVKFDRLRADFARRKADGALSQEQSRSVARGYLCDLFADERAREHMSTELDAHPDLLDESVAAKGTSSAGLVAAVLAALRLSSRLSSPPFRASAFNSTDVVSYARANALWLTQQPAATADFVELCAEMLINPLRADIRALVRVCVSAGDLVDALRAAPDDALNPVATLCNRAATSASSLSSSSAPSASALSARPLPICAFECAERHFAADCPRLRAHRARCGVPAAIAVGGCWSCNQAGHSVRSCTKFPLASIVNGTSSKKYARPPRTALHAPGKIDNEHVVVTIDTGANVSCADADLVHRLGLHVSDEPLAVALPGGGSLTSAGSTSFDLAVGDGVVPLERVVVIDNLGHDVLLGTDTLLAPASALAIAPTDDGECIVTIGTASVTASTSSSARRGYFEAGVATDDLAVASVIGRTCIGDTPYIYIVDALDERDADIVDLPTSMLAALESLALVDDDASVDERLLYCVSSLHAIDLDDPTALFASEPSPPPPPPPATPASSADATLPDALDVCISPAMSDDVIRATALRVRRYAHLFGGSTRPGTLQSPPRSQAPAFRITLTRDADLRSIRAADRRYSPAALDAMRAQVVQWLAGDAIELSTAPFSSAPVAVTKKDGKTRMCHDFRTVNNLSLLSQWPAARVDDCLARAAEARRLSAFDLWSQFTQIPIDDELSRDLTSFRFDGQLYRFRRAPFGLTGLPAHAQAFTQATFKNAIVYADDIHAPSADDAPTTLLATLDDMLSSADAANYTFKGSKVHLFYARSIVLGREVEQHCVAPLADATHALATLPTPTSRDELRRLLHAAGHWRQHLPLLSKTIAPLLRAAAPSQAPFALDAAAVAALGELRAMLSSPVVCAPPDYDRAMHLRTDYSAAALSWIVFQVDDNGVDRVVYCGGRATSKYERRYAAHRGELLALREAVRGLPHLLGAARHPFVWHTDNKPMVSGARDAPLSRDAVVARMQLELQTTPFSAEYTAGSSSAQALPDFLSRLPRTTSSATPPPHSRDVGSTPDTPC